MKWTYEIITLFTELKLIKYISCSEMLKIFWFWHTHSDYETRKQARNECAGCLTPI